MPLKSLCEVECIHDHHVQLTKLVPERCKQIRFLSPVDCGINIKNWVFSCFKDEYSDDLCKYLLLSTEILDAEPKNTHCEQHRRIRGNSAFFSLSAKYWSMRRVKCTSSKMLRKASK